MIDLAALDRGRQESGAYWVELLKLVLAQLNDYRPIALHIDRRFAETLLAKLMNVPIDVRLIAVLPELRVLALVATPNESAPSAAGALLIGPLLPSFLVLLLLNDGCTLFHDFEALLLLVEYLLGGHWRHFLLRLDRHVQVGSAHEIADLP